MFRSKEYARLQNSMQYILTCIFLRRQGPAPAAELKLVEGSVGKVYFIGGAHHSVVNIAFSTLFIWLDIVPPWIAMTAVLGLVGGLAWKYAR